MLFSNSAKDGFFVYNLLLPRMFSSEATYMYWVNSSLVVSKIC